jgi:CMD domain protein
MDIVTTLAGVPDEVTALRGHRQVAVDQTQLAYELLLEPDDETSMSRSERWAVAAFVAILHADDAASEHYLDGLRTIDADLAATIETVAEDGVATGPYGSYPAGPLTVEDVPGGELVLDPLVAERLGTRLATALGHAHRLVLHPRDARPEWLAALSDAGWDRRGIVVLSQLVSYLAYQLRLVAGLRAVQEARS